LSKKKDDLLNEFIRVFVDVRVSANNAKGLKDHPDFLHYDGRGITFRESGEVAKAMLVEKEPGTYDERICTIDYEDFRTRFLLFLRDRKSKFPFTDDIARKRRDGTLPIDRWKHARDLLWRKEGMLLKRTRVGGSQKGQKRLVLYGARWSRKTHD